VLLALTLIVATLGRGAMEPSLEIVLNYLLAAMIYVLTEAGAQPGLVLFSAAVAMLFLIHGAVGDPCFRRAVPVEGKQSTEDGHPQRCRPQE
jgi:hypothetical protein